MTPQACNAIESYGNYEMERWQQYYAKLCSSAGIIHNTTLYMMERPNWNFGIYGRFKLPSKTSSDIA